MTSIYRSGGKRVFDIVASLLLLIVLAPVIVIVALGVVLSLGWPVFFRQQRPGLDGRPFLLIKFRSMTSESGRNGELVSDERRLTRIGKLIRKTSLDELPELWNVLRGDMSLVGPRPLLMRYLSRYDATQARRHEVRPGITGYAQVRGRNSLTWEEKFNCDVWYVDHLSFFADMRILGETIVRVAFARGISQPGEATAQEFMGTSPERTSK